MSTTRDNERFYTHTALARGLQELFLELEARLKLDAPLTVYLAGGMAVHLYTGKRVTTDVDAEFAGRLAIPQDLVIDIQHEDGSTKALYFDVNYNPIFALIHERYQEDSIALDIGLSDFQLRVLSPLDLAVSKLVRFASNDRDDVHAPATRGLFTALELKRRADEALEGFVGGQSMVQLNIRDAFCSVKSLEDST